MDEKMKIHREWAVKLFNETWDLIDKVNRTPEEDSQMLEKAHASLYHWRQCGTALNIARGQWQISRVHSILGNGKAALFHGRQSLQICEDNHIGYFDLAFAHEAVARASFLIADYDQWRKFIDSATVVGNAIKEKEDRNYLLSELEAVQEMERNLVSKENILE